MTDDPDLTVHQETVTFLEENPDCESDLETLLEIDSAMNSWEFDDIPLDSGTFGEIVSRGIATSEGDGYRLADSDAVRAALAGEAVTTVEESENGSRRDIDVQIDRNAALGLVGALLVVVTARVVHIRSVFYEGRVISPGNDPYFFRYWQEQLLAEASGPHSLGVLVDPPWSGGDFNQRPLTHATNWWFAELLGGSQWAADMVTAWLPLVFTLVLAVVVYYMTLLLTNDVRVGIGSVLVLALAPIHATFTGVGLLHHRYNQYLWFGVILLAIVWLGTDLKRRRIAVGPTQAVSGHAAARKSWYVAGVLAVALAFWTHSWGGSLELFGALAVYVALRVCLDVREGISPGQANLPLVSGFILGGILALGMHLGLGWHGLPAPATAIGMSLFAAFMIALGEYWHRRDRSVRSLLTVQATLGVVGAVSAAFLFVTTTDIVSRIVSSDAPDWQTSIQSESLYATEQFVLFGPVVQIGLEFYLALAALVWCLLRVYRVYEPGWLLIAVVSIHYLVLSGIMQRFAGRLVIVLAVLAGTGIVAVLAWIGLVSRLGVESDADSSPPTESRQTLEIPTPKRSGIILAVSLVIFAPSLLFVPTLMVDTTHDQAHFDVAAEIADHTETFDRDTPDDRILAPWENYRYYNYFTNGDSESERFGRFGYQRLGAERDIDDEWARSRGGYYIQTGLDIPAGESLDQLPALGPIDSYEHTQLLSVDDDAGIAAFALVSGTTLEIHTDDNRVQLSTTVTVSDRTFTYERTESAENGTAHVTVPYPGTYEIDGSTVTVDESDIETGRTIVVNQ